MLGFRRFWQDRTFRRFMEVLKVPKKADYIWQPVASSAWDRIGKQRDLLKTPEEKHCTPA